MLCVTDGVQNMSIRVEHRDHSTVLTCSADANPAPTYHWTDSTSNFTCNDASLVLNRPDDCTPASTTLTCTAVGFNGASGTANVTVNWTYAECRNKGKNNLHYLHCYHILLLQFSLFAGSVLNRIHL